MSVVEPLFVLVSTGLTVVGLAIVGAAVRAYAETERRGMIHLSLGFTLVVGATVATALSALLLDFASNRALLVLVVNNGFSMAGYAFVVYSIVSYN